MNKSKISSKNRKVKGSNASASIVVSKSKKSASTKKNGLSRFFSLNNRAAKTNFATHFIYGAFTIDIKTVTAGGKVKCNLKIDSKNFNFSSIITLSEKSFVQLQKMLEHIVSSARA
jgi:hypothetical protein